MLLTAGTNTLRVYAQDQDLNLSATQSRTIIYSIPAQLAVLVNGDGTVTPNLTGTTSQPTGATITITAVPALGWTFNGWTGFVTSGSTTISFIQQPGAVITANFLPGPYVPIAGLYDGLVQSAIVHPKRCGFTSLSVSAAGEVSGQLSFAGKNYTLKGSFDANGSFKQKIKRGTQPPLNLALNINLANPNDAINGTLTSKGLTASLSLHRIVWNSGTNPAPQAGAYTVVLPADPQNTSPLVPKGDGYARVTVDAAGAVAITGSLADGARINVFTSVSKSGTVPVYQNLSKGVLIGELVFRNVPGVSDLDGSLAWRRLKNVSAKNFPAGFGPIQLQTVGAKYTSPGAGLRITGTASTATVEIGGPGIQTPITKEVTIGTDNSVTVDVPGADNLTFQFNTANGTYTGSAVVNGKSRPFWGAFLQKQNGGGGFMPLGKQCGYVRIVAP